LYIYAQKGQKLIAHGNAMGFFFFYIGSRRPVKGKSMCGVNATLFNGLYRNASFLFNWLNKNGLFLFNRLNNLYLCGTFNGNVVI